ncbi:hypothetical protein C2845_PM04G19060 [Panicum miliaceum]|uniref:Uncharacterized protein n=1 Tax=Panicum miliaceum TaxID=4540 RepID=A0A3L6QRD0_PANMI|nr:hypothetical protein C2845_PM04G19060 [Panicum miliaceum]
MRRARVHLNHQRVNGTGAARVLSLGARIGRRVGRHAEGGFGFGVGPDRAGEHPGARDVLRALRGGQRRRHRCGGQQEDREGERARHVHLVLMPSGRRRRAW